MKLGFTLKDIKVADKATIGEVSINIQYQPGELQSEYALAKQVLKEVPVIIADLGQGCMAVEEMDQAFDNYVDAKLDAEATDETKTGARSIVLSVINKIKEAYVTPVEAKEENKAV